MRNYSKQREDVLNAIKELKNHPTAEEIYSKVKENNSTASKGTVYRNLKNLVIDKKIIKISKIEGPDRYDLVNYPHYHAICASCGKVFDFVYDFDVANIRKSLKKQIGENIDINDFSLQILCDKCKNKLQKNKI